MLSGENLFLSIVKNLLAYLLYHEELGFVNKHEACANVSLRSIIIIYLQ